MLRTATALLLALTFTYSAAESVLGAVRDGAVHHESDAVAIGHQIEGRSDHGQEDSAPPGADHRHGGASDHCTHVHGVSLGTSSVRVQQITPEQSAPSLVEPTIHAGHTSEAPFRPPRI